MNYVNQQDINNKQFDFIKEKYKYFIIALHRLLKIWATYMTICNGTTFEFYNLDINYLSDYLNLFLEFYPAKNIISMHLIKNFNFMIIVN